MAKTWNKPPKLESSTVELIFEEESLTDSDLNLEPVKTQAIRDIFGPGANPNRRYVSATEQVAEYANFLKGLGLSVVYTLGVWDLPHIGHCRYLQKAKEMGDILIVGTELDEAIRIRKGPQRPVVPFNERVEMLCHIRHVDLVVPIPDYDERGLSGMKMLESIRPNIFVVSKRSFREAEDTHDWIERAKQLSDQVTVLESMAETSTSAKIRGLLMDMGEYAKSVVNEAQESASAAMAQAFADVKKRIDDVIRKG